MAIDVDGYREFVASRMDQLRRTAYLLSGDWQSVDDVVSIALTKLFRKWPSMSTV